MTANNVSDDNVHVCCRVRPLSAVESESADQSCLRFPQADEDPNSITFLPDGAHEANIKEVTGGQAFTFSKVFPPDSAQENVYAEVARPVVMEVMAGYNGTVLAYGQTNSGKTHTMFGKCLRGRRTPAPEDLKKQREASALREAYTDPHLLNEEREGSPWKRTDARGAPPSPSPVASALAVGDRSPANVPRLGRDDKYSGVTSQDLHAPHEGDASSLPCTPSASPHREASRLPDTERSLPTLRGTLSAGGTPESVEFAGIVPRAVDDIFASIERAEASCEFELRLSMVEIYMEQIRDLLGGPAGRRLSLREDVASGSFYVDGCEMPCVGSAAEVMALVREGLRRRTTWATAMNSTSSRSHCVLSVYVKSLNLRRQESRLGKLFLVDLAGSEKVSRTQSEGLRLEEAKLINKSLTTLGMVIVSLAERTAHVPYRDSLLTKILKDSLGGNSRTTLVVCCSPSTRNATETLSTLRFGARAKRIQNRAVVNRQPTLSELKSMLDLAKEEIAFLQAALRKEQTSTASVGVSSLLSAPDPSSSRGVSSPSDSPSLASRRVGGGEVVKRERSRSPRDGHRVTTAITRIESLLEERARVQEAYRQLEAELRAAQDALQLTTETSEAAKKQREEVHQALLTANEEISVWEEEYNKLRRRLLGRESLIEQYRATVGVQREEIHLLTSQMESYLEPVRAALVAAKTAEATVLGPNVTPQRRRTLLALEHACTSASLVKASAPPTSADPALTWPFQATSSMEATSPPGDDTHPAEGLARQSSTPLSCTEGNGSGDDLRSSTPQRGAPPNVSTPLKRLATGARSANYESPAPTAPDGLGSAQALPAAAAQRITQLEEEVTAVQGQLDALHNAHNALTLELQLAQKKLVIRQDRIENMKLGLQQESSVNRELRQMLETERAGQRGLLQVARGDANYWRRRYEELSSLKAHGASGTGFSENSTSSCDFGTSGEHQNTRGIVKTIHGGSAQL